MIKSRRFAFSIVFFTLCLGPGFTPGGDRPVSEDPVPDYRNPDLPVKQRVEDLLLRMTLEEKVGQMNIPCGYKQAIGWGYFHNHRSDQRDPDGYGFTTE